MPTNVKDMVDENSGQRDNIGCKAKMKAYSDIFRSQGSKIETVDDLVRDYDDDTLQQTINDSKTVLDIAQYICESLAIGIKDLPAAMAGSVAIIRKRIKVVPPWVKINEDLNLVRLYKAANVMEDLMAYAEEIERLTKKTADMAKEASKTTDSAGAYLTEAMKELKKTQNEIIVKEKKEKDDAEAAEKEAIGEQGKKDTKTVKKLLDETTSAINKVKDMVNKAENLAKQSSGQNPDMEPSLKEAQDALEKATESLVETKKAAGETEKSNEKLAQLAKNKASTVEAVEQAQGEITSNVEQVEKHSTEAKSHAKVAEKSGKKVIDIVEDEKNRDKAWKTAKEAKKVAENIRKDAETASSAAEEAKGLADQITTDTEEATSMEKEIRTLSEDTQKTSEEVVKAADKTEAQAEEIEKLKTEGGESEDISRVLTETKDAIKEAKDAAERARNLSHKCKETGGEAKTLIEKQKAVHTSKEYGEEAKTLATEVRQLAVETADALAKAHEVAAEERGQVKGSNRDGEKVTATTNGEPEVFVDIDATLKEAEMVNKEAKVLQEETEKAAEKTQDVVIEIEERYQSSHGLEDLLKIAEKASKSFEKTKVVSAKAKETTGQAKLGGTKVINYVDDKKTKQKSNTMLLKVRELTQDLHKDIDTANSISTEADAIVAKVTTDMEDNEAMVQEVKEAGQNAKTAAEELQKVTTVLEDKTSTLETQISEKSSNDTMKETMQSMHEDIEHAQKLRDETKNTIKLSQQVTSERGERVNLHEKHDVVKAINPVIEDAKRVARESRDFVKEVKLSAKEAQHAADDCGRDTDEARRAIQIVEEAIYDTKKTASEMTRCAEAIDRVIDDLTSIIKHERSTAEEVKKSEEKLVKCVQNANKTTEKAKSCMERSSKAIDDMTTKNPKSWKSTKYVSQDAEVLSVIRAPDDALHGINVTCKENESLAKSVVGEHEELLSNVVTMEPQDVKLNKPALVGIRYTPTIRVPGYEVVVKARDQNGDWKVIPTNSTDRSYDDFKGLNFAEVKVDQLSTYVVVRRVIRDRHSMGRRGGTVTSSVDPRISLTYPKETLSSSTDVTLQVIPSDVYQINARRNKWQSLKYLVSTSPMLHFAHARNVKLKKPLTVTLPILTIVQEEDDFKKDGQPIQKPSSPSTGTLTIPGVGRFGGKSHGEKETKKKKEVPNTDEVLLMGRDQKGSWRKVAGTIEQQKKSGVIEAKIPDGYDRVLAVQMKEGSIMPPSKAAAAVEMNGLMKVANVILHHYAEDRARVIVQVVPSHRCDDVVRDLAKKGYEGPPYPSNEIEIREEQEFTVEFKQNIKLMDQEMYGDHKIIFREAFSNRMELFLEAADPYRNHSSDYDRGSAHFSKKDSDISRVNVDPSLIESEWQHVVDLPVALPKVEREFKSKHTMKEAVDSDAPLSNIYLRDLAKELCDELEKLAVYLGTRQSQIQRVKRDHPYQTEDQIYDLLISWRNKTKKSLNKVDILATALEKSGRTDLGEKVRDDAKNRK